MIELALAYRGLADIDDVEPVGHGDVECFEEVRQVLRKHGKLERFGLILLHSHFPISEDEVLIETCDSENRVLTMKVVKDTELEQQQTVETQWRLDNDRPTGQCKIKCFKYEVGGRHAEMHSANG